MRLWHPYLIDKLPRQQLLGQHRECCALRGLGWGKKHATVNYVFEHPYLYLYVYHFDVMREMDNRCYSVYESWFDPYYRGNILKYDYSGFIEKETFDYNNRLQNSVIYPEHDNRYLGECLENLKKKNVFLKIDIETRMQLSLLGFSV